MTPGIRPNARCHEELMDDSTMQQGKVFGGAITHLALRLTDAAGSKYLGTLRECDWSVRTQCETTLTAKPINARHPFQQEARPGK